MGSTTLTLYVTLFYFTLSLYLLVFLVLYLTDLFYFFLALNLLLVAAGISGLTILLMESYYLRIFLAMSSILNTLLVLLAISTTSPIS